VERLDGDDAEENAADKCLPARAMPPLAASSGAGAVSESLMFRPRRRHNSDDGSLLNSYDYLKESGM
jgi:hypothetical protein